MKILLWFVQVLFACHGSSYDCDEAHACGFGKTCQAGTCVESRCATSAQCPMESYCVSGECLPGCAEDYDCVTGYHCDLEARTCVQDECADSYTDCDFREFCNVATGECYDAGDQYCKFCDEDWECGEGNVCFAHYCGVNCTNSECPAGFSCEVFTDGYGNIVTYQCLAPCWLYEDFDEETF